MSGEPTSAVKRFLLWTVAAWICAVSILAAFEVWSTGDPGNALFCPMIAATFMAFVWIVGDGFMGLTPWPAICGWAVLGWQILGILFAMVAS